jgi:hypothetical protein
MSQFTINLDLSDMLTPAIKRIKDNVRNDLQKQALEIVEQEVAKMAIDISHMIDIRRMGHDLVITIRNEAKK